MSTTSGAPTGRALPGKEPDMTATLDTSAALEPNTEPEPAAASEPAAEPAPAFVDTPIWDEMTARLGTPDLSVVEQDRRALGDLMGAYDRNTWPYTVSALELPDLPAEPPALEIEIREHLLAELTASQAAGQG